MKPKRSTGDDDEPNGTTPVNGVKMRPMLGDRSPKRQTRTLVAQEGNNCTAKTSMLCPGDTPRESDTLSVHSYLCPKMSDASTITDVFSSSFDDETGPYRGRSSVATTTGLSVCRRSRACCVVLYIWIALFLLGCMVAIVLVVTRIVLPYARTVRFHDTTCNPRAQDTMYTHEDISCSCGRSCQAVYPCLTVVVNYDDVNMIQHEAILFDSEDRLSKQCSYYPQCKSNRDANIRAVNEYQNNYGVPGKKFSCLYNPSNPNEVIRTRRFHLNHVIHGLVWSCLVFLGAIILLVCAIRKKQCHFL